jgi:NAD(P)-dependent dehydrogenase (short-subunit alcohol dehydrogenase family)
MALQRFEGRVALVTGAAAGIGRATALRLGQEGALLILADRNLAGAQGVAEQIKAAGGNAQALGYDALVPGESEAMVDRAIAVHGRLNAVLNIAGVYHRSHFVDITGADWTRILTVNLTSVFQIVQRALPALIETRGNVVNTASVAGVEGIAYAAPYAAAKAGVINLTKSLAAEFAHTGVRFNVVCPGRVRTDIGVGLTVLENVRPELATHPARLLGREDGGTAEDMAGTYAYLASDDAIYVSGSVAVVDGAKMAG